MGIRLIDDVEAPDGFKKESKNNQKKNERERECGELLKKTKK